MKVFFFLVSVCVAVSGCQKEPELAVFLLLGQSNMEGRSYGGITERLPVDNEILALSWDGAWKAASTPLHGRGEGPGISFAVELKELGYAKRIGLVPLAVGGSGIDRWSKGGDLYQMAIETAGSLPSGKIKGILWHQGETDTESMSQAVSYEFKLHKLISDLRADLDQPELPFVVGELGHWLYEREDRKELAETINRALSALPKQVGHTAFVSADGLSNSDQWHFSVEGIRELGKRYAEAYFEFED